MKESIIIETAGVLSDNGFRSEGSRHAAEYIRNSKYLDVLEKQNISLHWNEDVINSSSKINSLDVLKDLSLKISNFTYREVKKHNQFLIIGGDHSTAVGTWAGVKKALKSTSFALVWMDAHMDAHTLLSSPTGNLHGMPVSILTNNGEDALQNTYPSDHFVKGEDLYFFGSRDFEVEEEDLLCRMGSNVFKMNARENKSAAVNVFKEMMEEINGKYDYFGITLDMDLFDPFHVPGVNSPSPNGMLPEDILEILSKIKIKNKLIGFEICEFNPFKDTEHKTEKLLIECIRTVFSS